MTLNSSGGEAPILAIWGMWSAPSMLLFPGLLWSELIVSVRIPSMGQIDPFKMYFFLIGPYAKKKKNF